MKILLLLLTLILFSCNKTDKKVETKIYTEDKIWPTLISPSNVKGDIVIAGSSTVFPLVEKTAEMFSREGFTGKITINSVGSGAGFERFCIKGETDIALSSVKISEDNIKSALKINRDIVEFKIGIDDVVICTSIKNTFLTNISIEEVAKIFSTAEKWSDVNKNWPNENIRKYSPGTDSGTFIHFVDKIFNGDKKPILSSYNLQMSEDDNILIQGIKDEQYAIGYFGYVYYNENKNILKVLSINGIKPTGNNIYILSRPLYLYSSKNIIKNKPQVAAFINYFISNVNFLIKKSGYFPLSESDLNISKQNWINTQ